MKKGWPAPTKVPTRGPAPKCKGCGKRIERDEERVRHVAFAKSNHNHPTVSQFHARASCLWGIPKAQLDGLLEKHWTQRNMQLLVKQLEMVDSSSEE